MTICPLIYFTFFSSADRWLNAPLSRQEVALSNTAHSSSVSPPQFLSHRGASQHDDGWCSFHLLVCVFWGQMSRQQPTTPQSSASAPFKHTREKKHEVVNKSRLKPAVSAVASEVSASWLGSMILNRKLQLVINQKNYKKRLRQKQTLITDTC